MENIARFETNEQLRKVLNEKSGIGTPATRAGMIEGVQWCANSSFVEARNTRDGQGPCTHGHPPTGNQTAIDDCFVGARLGPY